MTIDEIADQINIKSKSYKIGKLQNIRKEIKALSQMSTRKIFGLQGRNPDWAFHAGGRNELQFNIGNEKEGIRYGFAFSLVPSQALPKPDILYPKILKLNAIIADTPELFEKYKMWHHGKAGRSAISDVKSISEDIVQIGNFIFIGQIIPSGDPIDIDQILETFDDLLDIYIEVESGSNLPNVKVPRQVKSPVLQQVQSTAFVFKSTPRNLPQSTSYTSVKREINVEARHSYIQEKLISELTAIHGPHAVAAENYIGGKKIDVVLKINNDYIFYEVKTASSAKACIRQAVGQLLEYSYFTCTQNAVQIVVVGEHTIDSDTKKYLDFLQQQFGLPLEYKTVK